MSTLNRRQFIATGIALAGVAALPAWAQDAQIAEMSIGAEDAPVTMIEYASYTCPHCANFHTGAFKQIKENYIDTGKVRFVMREVYFDRPGLWASMVARCDANKFWGISDMLFERQSTWSRAGEPAQIVDELRKIGRLAGMTDETLDACLQDSAKAQGLVDWYRANAAADNVTSTPSFLIDGKAQSNAPYEELAAALDDALNA